MLDWHIDEEGAITNMAGIDSPAFMVSPALLGNGFIAVERFPGGLTVSNFAETMSEGIAWCEEAARQFLAVDLGWACGKCHWSKDVGN